MRQPAPGRGPGRPPSYRDQGAVLLLSGYELGHPPIGLASPLGFLEQAGYEPAACDLALGKLDEEAVRRARFVGFSVPMHTGMRIAVAAAAEVRRIHPAAHRCFYGLYAPLQRALLRGADPAGPLADSILGGEYEQSLVALIDSLEAGQSPLPEPPPSLVRLRFVPPSRTSLPALSRYSHLERPDGTRAPAGYVEASRGCLHRCRHCPIPAVYQGRFFVVPVETVLADVRAQVALGADHVTIGDPDFLNGPGHAMAVARAIHAEFPRLTFDVTAKVEHLLARPALLPELAALGCLFVTSAVESLSDRVLGILDKGHTRNDVARAIGVVQAAGLAIRPTFVPFTPWSTLEEHLGLFDFLDEHALWNAVDPVQLSIRLLVPEGSLLLDRPEMRRYLKEDSFDPGSLSHRWTHPDPRMDELQRESAALVHESEVEREPPPVTHLRLRALARAKAGLPPDIHATLRFPTEGAPRMTESWFC